MKDDVSPHLIDARFTINLLVARYYVGFSFGRDVRSGEPPVTGGRRQDPRRTFLYLSIFLWIAVVTVLGSTVVLYLLKAALGIDVFAHAHPLRMVLTPLGICPSES